MSKTKPKLITFTYTSSISWEEEFEIEAKNAEEGWKKAQKYLHERLEEELHGGEGLDDSQNDSE